MKTKDMKIQRNSINQNSQPNFGITVKWTVWQCAKKPTPKVKTNNAKPKVKAGNTNSTVKAHITSMKQLIRKLVEHMPATQKVELYAIMDALQNIQGTLEFIKPHPDNETLIQLLTTKDNAKKCTFIKYNLFKPSVNIEFLGNKLINATRNLLQPDTQVSTKGPIKLKELLRKFGISA